MAVPNIPNVGSQLDRAIVAYLIAQGAGTAANIFPAYGVLIKGYPNITVKSISSEHDPVNTGTEKWIVQIQGKQTATVPAGTANPELQRVTLDTLIGNALACLLQSSDGMTLDFTAAAITTAGNALAGANNTDMANFTLEHLYYKGATRGQPDEDGCAWVEIRTFECHVAPSANLAP